MITIHLDKLKFFAHHGLHDEEAITGTNFEINAAIEFDPAGKVIFLHQTINYARIYEVIRKHMMHPVALLELLAENIADDIYLLDSRIASIFIQIIKLHAPVPGIDGQVGISYRKTFAL